MDMDLNGKVALVTGGSRGIGAAVATRLAAAGADVVLTYQQDQSAAAAVTSRIKAGGRRALSAAVDSADPDAVSSVVDRTVEEFGRLDVLVNSAAVFHVAPLADLDVDDFDRTVAVNVCAPFVAAKAAAVHMDGSGRIITIGSNMVERTVFAGFSLYSMSKTALVGLTKGAQS